MFSKLFKRKEKPLEVAKQPAKLTHEDMKVIQQRLVTTSQSIYKATLELNEALRRPVTAVEVAGYLSIDSARVTPRMPGLIKKKLVVVDHWEKHSDRRWRKYYKAVVNDN